MLNTQLEQGKEALWYSVTMTSVVPPGPRHQDDLHIVGLSLCSHLGCHALLLLAEEVHPVTTSTQLLSGMGKRELGQQCPEAPALEGGSGLGRDQVFPGVSLSSDKEHLFSENPVKGISCVASPEVTCRGGEGQGRNGVSLGLRKSKLTTAAPYGPGPNAGL